MLGVSKEKMPSSTEMLLILTYMRMHMKNVLVDEIRIAFDLAVAGKLKHPTKPGNPPLDLDLYGNTLSMKYVADVLNAYLAYKNPIVKQLASSEENLNTYDRAKGVLDLISTIPDAIETLKQIGADKPKEEKELHPYYDMHQRWMRQWDKLRDDTRFVVPKTNARFVKRYGEVMDIDRFFNKKAEQLQVAKDREKNKEWDDL